MKPFHSFIRNHSNARAPQTVRKRRLQSRKSVHFPNFMSLGRCQLLHRYIYSEWTNAFSCFSLFSYSRLSPRITTKKNFHTITPNLNFKMRHIWILNNTSSTFLWYFVYGKFRKSKLRAPVTLQVLFHSPGVENKLNFF